MVVPHDPSPVPPLVRHPDIINAGTGEPPRRLRGKPLKRARTALALGAILLCCCAAAISCRDPVVPEQYFPRSAVPLDPVPEIYETWWAETEACSRRKGDFTAVRFYIVPGAEGWRWGNSTIEGSWVELGNRITVGELRSLRARILRHEMLHAILRTGEHPPEYFETRCGSIVAR